ncbi:MAG: gatA [Rickettsiales bacterium]|jgi:aspartyl-tRNA(Asn)/glutamyl-tRNA(Gln) amidotransferase subunit A|nr:gatA [Rickettsiales bacterium]
MTELAKLTIAEARTALQKKALTSVELTTAHIKAVENIRDLNAYIIETPEIALEAAKASDARRAKGEVGKMEGIPVAVKDLFCTKGVRSTSCSHILDGFTPTYESTVTENLFREGGIMVGKTNMDEFAMGSANITSYYGPVKNPWVRKDGTEVVPGGSSGGSSAAVAAYACMGALGSDTGGSIRQPAAFTGTVGIKPTYGRCSRYGMIAFASSLDQAGVFTRNVRDAAIMLESICGHDPKDSTSSLVKTPNFEAALTGNIKGLRIGIPHEYHAENMPEEVERMWFKGREWLEQAGAEIVNVSLPHTKYALPTYYIIAPAEASSNLARYDGVRYGLRVYDEGDSLNDMYEKTRAAGFGHEVKRRIMTGTYVLSAGYYDAYYTKAQRVRSLIAKDFTDAFQKVDVLLTPATPTPAFAVGEKMDPVTMYLNDVFTVPASLAGLPGLVLPSGLASNGLPLGLQLTGKPFDEEMVFRVAGILEEAAEFQLTPQRAAA